MLRRNERTKQNEKRSLAFPKSILSLAISTWSAQHSSPMHGCAITRRSSKRRHQALDRSEHSTRDVSSDIIIVRLLGLLHSSLCNVVRRRRNEKRKKKKRYGKQAKERNDTVGWICAPLTWFAEEHFSGPHSVPLEPRGLHSADGKGRTRRSLRASATNPGVLTPQGFMKAGKKAVLWSTSPFNVASAVG